jgi:hypothetical protein
MAHWDCHNGATGTLANLNKRTFPCDHATTEPAAVAFAVAYARQSSPQMQRSTSQEADPKNHLAQKRLTLFFLDSMIEKCYPHLWITHSRRTPCTAASRDLL